jgi:hypothetical protein
MTVDIQKLRHCVSRGYQTPGVAASKMTYVQTQLDALVRTTLETGFGATVLATARRHWQLCWRRARATR